MWPFARKREAEVAPSGPKPVPAPIIRREWTRLPAIQRVIGQHPLTAPPKRFSDDLVTHQDPSVSSDRMGHQVSAEAPAGIVLTVARPAATRADGPAMVSRPRLQRKAQEAPTELGEWNGDEAAPFEARPIPISESVGGDRSIPLMESIDGGRSLPLMESIDGGRSLPLAGRVGEGVVTHPVVERLAEMPLLTSFPADTQPTPVLDIPGRPPMVPQLQQSPVQRMAVHEVGPVPRLTLGQARRLGLGAPIKKVSEPKSVQRTAEVAATDARPSATELPAPAPLMLEGELVKAPESQSLPLVKRQASDPGEMETAVVNPIAAPDALLTISRATVPDSGSPSSPGDAASGSSIGRPESVPMMDSASGRLDLPLAPIGKVSAGDVAEPFAPDSLPPIDRSVIESRSVVAPAEEPLVQRSPDVIRSISEMAPAPATHAERPPETSSLRSVSLPLAADRAPIIRSTSVMERIGPAARSNSSAIAPLVSDQPLHPVSTIQRTRDQSASRPAAAFGVPSDGLSSNGAHVFASESELPLQRAAVTPESRPLQMRQRTERIALDPKTGMETLHHADGPLPLAPTMIIQRYPSSEPDASTQEPPPLTSAFGVQREVIAAAPASVEAGDAPAASAVRASTETTSAGRASETDMDLLAGRLYDKIRSRLRTELLIDRERAGFLTDLR